MAYFSPFNVPNRGRHPHRLNCTTFIPLPAMWKSQAAIRKIAYVVHLRTRLRWTYRRTLADVATRPWRTPHSARRDVSPLLGVWRSPRLACRRSRATLRQGVWKRSCPASRRICSPSTEQVNYSKKPLQIARAGFCWNIPTFGKGYRALGGPCAFLRASEGFWSMFCRECECRHPVSSSNSICKSPHSSRGHFHPRHFPWRTKSQRRPSAIA